MKYLTILLLTFGISHFTFSQSSFKDIVYAKTEKRDLLLDIYLPEKTVSPYLVVWVHGGAWHSGSKENPPMGLVKLGCAMASVDYRLSIEAPMPAMVQDIKAAIRFLRGNAKKYGYRSDQIIIWGSSAGGHLAALVGTTNGNEKLEGNLGDYKNQSSDVSAVIDFYGPTNFMTILQQSTPHGVSVRAPALALLLGKPVEQVPEFAKLTSPVYQVDPSDPPMFIAHGDQDVQVPVNQSLELKAAYEKNNVKVQLEIVSGAGHGNEDYYTDAFMEKVDAFIKSVLK